MLLRQPWLLLAGSLILLAVLRGTTCCSLARVREPFAIAWSYDTSGYLETCGCSARQLGGVAKRATMLSDLRSKQPVLAIEGAHIVEDRGEFQLFKGVVIAKALKLMHYDVLVFGVREAQQGAEGLERIEKSAEIPCICANLSVAGQPWPQRSAVVEVAGGKVGITAVSQPELVQFDMPKGITFTDPAAALQQELGRFKHRVGMRIACLEGEGPWIEEMTKRFAKDADLFLTGNRDMATATLEFHDTPPWLNSYKMGQYLGLCTVDPQPGGVRITGSNLPIEDTLADDAAVKELIDKDYKPQLKQLFYGTFKQQIQQLYMPPEYCADCHKEQYDAYTRSAHARALRTLSDASQLYNPDCMKCHVVYDAKTDDLYAMNCVTCHSDITDQHVYDAVNGKVQPPAAKATMYTYEWCSRCHDEMNSLPFKEHWPQYANAIYHGGDFESAKAAAKDLGLRITALPPPHARKP